MMAYGKIEVKVPILRIQQIDVGKVINYWLEGQSSIPGRGNIFSHAIAFRLPRGSTQPLIEWVPMAISAGGGGRSQYKSDHSFPSGDERNNEFVISPLTGRRSVYLIRFDVLTAVAMKNVVFWDIRTQYVPHRKHITSPLQSPGG
jgi:hypothetical protein